MCVNYSNNINANAAFNYFIIILKLFHNYIIIILLYYIIL